MTSNISSNQLIVAATSSAPLAAATIDDVGSNDGCKNARSNTEHSHSYLSNTSNLKDIETLVHNRQSTTIADTNASDVSQSITTQPKRSDILSSVPDNTATDNNNNSHTTVAGDQNKIDIADESHNLRFINNEMNISTTETIDQSEQNDQKLIAEATLPQTRVVVSDKSDDVLEDNVVIRPCKNGLKKPTCKGQDEIVNGAGGGGEPLINCFVDGTNELFVKMGDPLYNLMKSSSIKDHCSPPPGIKPTSSFQHLRHSFVSNLPHIIETPTCISGNFMQSSEQNQIRGCDSYAECISNDNNSIKTFKKDFSSLLKRNVTFRQPQNAAATHLQTNGAGIGGSCISTKPCRHSIASLDELISTEAAVAYKQKIRHFHQSTVATDSAVVGGVCGNSDFRYRELSTVNTGKQHNHYGQTGMQQSDNHPKYNKFLENNNLVERQTTAMPSMHVDHLMYLLSSKLCTLDEESSSIDQKLDLYEYHCRKKLEDTREQLKKRIDELVESCAKQIDETTLERRRRLQIFERNVENHLTTTHSLLTQAKIKLSRARVTGSELDAVINVLLDCLVKTKKLQRESTDFNYWLDFVPRDPLETDNSIGSLRFLEFSETMRSDVSRFPDNVDQPENVQNKMPYIRQQLPLDQRPITPNMDYTENHCSGYRKSLTDERLLPINGAYSRNHMANDIVQRSDQNGQDSGSIQALNTPLDNEVVIRNLKGAGHNGNEIFNRRNSWHPSPNTNQHYNAPFLANKTGSPESPMQPSQALLHSRLGELDTGKYHIQAFSGTIPIQSPPLTPVWTGIGPMDSPVTPFVVPTNLINSTGARVMPQPTNATILTPIAMNTNYLKNLSSNNTIHLTTSPLHNSAAISFQPGEIRHQHMGPIDDCAVIRRKIRNGTTFNHHNKHTNRMSMAGFVTSSLLTLDMHHPIVLDCYGDPLKHLKCIKSLCFMSYNRLLICENGRRTGHKNVLIFTLNGNFVSLISPPGCPFVNPTGLCVMQRSNSDGISAKKAMTSSVATQVSPRSDNSNDQNDVMAVNDNNTSAAFDDGGNAQTILVTDGNNLKLIDPQTCQIISVFELNQSGDQPSTQITTLSGATGEAPNEQLINSNSSALSGNNNSSTKVQDSNKSSSLAQASKADLDKQDSVFSNGVYHRQDRYGGICAVDNVVHVCDRKIPAIKIFDIRKKSIVTKWSPEGIRNPNFTYRKNDRLYMSDSSSNRVIALNASDGKMLGELCSTLPSTNNKSLFNNPSGMCDDGEHLAVADLYNNRIQLFSNDLLVGSIYSPCIESPFSIAYHPTGAIAISNGRPRTVTLYFTMLQ